ncbi:hypothetical protein B1757_09960 [Acidithiobacillus marinus]|uniref:Uncharacterized protein n=1 Tax=Acidithiobacillus marinus TaxID=187490 RepID=A0A2I1DKM4_9PROT|nr:hypothetical protein [Acidithiobacillus marinus]PKY10414.1 hypothetical protein B1757_09960 [Acidithiobacillus marinus]
MTRPQSRAPRSRKHLFWLGVAVCTAVGMQAQALAAVDTPYSIPSPYANNPGMAGNTSSDWSADSTYAEWHGYAPHDMPNPPAASNNWHRPQTPMPTATFNEVADWVPPPPGPYPNGSHEGGMDATAPSSMGAPQGGYMPAYPAAPGEGEANYGSMRPAPYGGPAMPGQSAAGPAYGPPAYAAGPYAQPPQYYGPGPGYEAPGTPMKGAGYPPPVGYPQGPYHGPFPSYGRPDFGPMGPMPYPGANRPWQNATRPAYAAPHPNVPAYGQPAYGPPPSFARPPQYGPGPDDGAYGNTMNGRGYPPMEYPQGPHDGPPPAYGQSNYGPMPPAPYPGANRPWQNGPRPDFGAPAYGPSPYGPHPEARPPQFYGPQPSYGYP